MNVNPLRGFALAILAISLYTSTGRAEDKRWLVPVFAESVAASAGSEWRSELRIFNPGSEVATFGVAEHFPHPGTQCSTLASIQIPPRGFTQVRTLGCTPGGAAAAEIIGSPQLVIQSVMINVDSSRANGFRCVENGPSGGLETKPSCLTGPAQWIPVLPIDQETYTERRVMPNLAASEAVNRHNIGVVNPNPVPVKITLVTSRMFGNAPLFVTHVSHFEVPAESSIQLLDHFIWRYIPPAFAFDAYFMVAANTEPAVPVYAYASVVDVPSKDATFLPSVPLVENQQP